jgi:phosphatidate cytidylyltransferase
MLTRILTAIVALILLIPLLVLGGVWGAGALFALLSGFCVYEMLGCCGLLKKWIISVPAILISALAALLPIAMEAHFTGCVVTLLGGMPALLVCFLIAAVLMHKTIDVERLLMFFSLAVYIAAGFTALSTVRLKFGLWAVALILCVVWFTDTFAYFSGMFFGNKKLCPEISPKKTIAGAIGGTIFGTLSAILIFYLWGHPLYFGIIGLPLSIISQFGDLAASVIKRRFGVKDYGKIFPGHGGVLDRFDSIIPVSIFGAASLFAISYFF